MSKELTWDDADDIGILLSQKHPDISASLLMRHAIWLQTFTEIMDESAHSLPQANILETNVQNSHPPTA